MNDATHCSNCGKPYEYIVGEQTDDIENMLCKCVHTRKNDINEARLGLNNCTWNSMVRSNNVDEHTTCPWCASKNTNHAPTCVQCGGPLG